MRPLMDCRSCSIWIRISIRHTWFLGQLHLQRRRPDEAITELTRARDLSGGSPYMRALLGYAYGRAGRSDETRAVIAELKELSRTSYVTPLGLAILHLSLEDKDRAFEYLEKAYEDRKLASVDAEDRSDLREPAHRSSVQQAGRANGLPVVRPAGRESTGGVDSSALCARSTAVATTGGGPRSLPAAGGGVSNRNTRAPAARLIQRAPRLRLTVSRRLL